MPDRECVTLPGPFYEGMPKHSPERSERARRLRAARYLRRQLIALPWYAEADRTDGMAFWLRWHGSQILTRAPS